MFSVITNIYNKKTKGPTLMGLFTATGKLKRYVFIVWSFFIIAAVKNIDAPTLTREWQELEYRIDVCRVTRGAHIEHL
jgi:cbb3-type cytochrome oxidase subunit 1